MASLSSLNCPFLSTEEKLIFDNKSRKSKEKIFRLIGYFMESLEILVSLCP